MHKLIIILAITAIAGTSAGLVRTSSIVTSTSPAPTGTAVGDPGTTTWRLCCS